jgi:hypothetical protein
LPWSYSLAHEKQLVGQTPAGSRHAGAIFVVGVGQGKAAQDVHFIENGMPDFNAPVPDRYVDGG